NPGVGHTRQRERGQHEHEVKARQLHEGGASDESRHRPTSQGNKSPADTILTAPMPAFLRSLALLAALAAGSLVAVGSAFSQEDDQKPRVLAVEFENDVNPITADYLTD